jgi:hypothetical protein
VRITTPQFAHRKELHNAFLGLHQPVVTPLQRLLYFRQLDLLVPAPFVPGESQNPVEVVANDLVLARRGGQHAQSLCFAPRLLTHPLRKLCVVDLLEQFHRFLLPRIRLTQLRLNRPELLPEVELALMLLDLDFRLFFHVLHHASASHFALQT